MAFTPPLSRNVNQNGKLFMYPPHRSDPLSHLMGPSLAQPSTKDQEFFQNLADNHTNMTPLAEVE